MDRHKLLTVEVYLFVQEGRSQQIMLWRHCNQGYIWLNHVLYTFTGQGNK